MKSYAIVYGVAGLTFAVLWLFWHLTFFAVEAALWIGVAWLGWSIVLLRHLHRRARH